MSPLHLDVTKLIHLLTPQTKTTLHVDHIYYSLSFSIITYTNKEMNITDTQQDVTRKAYTYNPTCLSHHKSSVLFTGPDSKSINLPHKSGHHITNT